MIKFLVILAGLMFLNTISIIGQNQSDSIYMKKGLGTTFFQNGKKLKPKQLLEVTKYNLAAHSEMKFAKGNYDIANMFSFAGGILIGWPLGAAIAGADPNWALAAVGVGLIAISIPFSIGYKKHAKQAVEIYNSGISQTGFRISHFNIGFTYYGIGIKATF